MNSFDAVDGTLYINFREGGTALRLVQEEHLLVVDSLMRCKAQTFPMWTILQDNSVTVLRVRGGGPPRIELAGRNFFGYLLWFVSFSSLYRQSMLAHSSKESTNWRKNRSLGSSLFIKHVSEILVLARLLSRKLILNEG